MLGVVLERVLYGPTSVWGLCLGWLCASEQLVTLFLRLACLFVEYYSIAQSHVAIDKATVIG